MPELRSADWSKVKFRCSVIMLVPPATLRVQVESRDIEIDEDVHHWDYLGSRICARSGNQISIRTDGLPPDFIRTNAVFWITHDNTIVPPGQLVKRLFFRREHDEQPAAIVATAI